MKRILYIIILVQLLPSLNAQNFRLSFVANPQIGWMHPDKSTVSNEGAVLGLLTGIEADFFFAENYAFSTGLFLNQTGGRLAYSDTISLRTSESEVSIVPGNTVKYGFQYLGIPLGLKLRTVEVGYSTFWLHAGLTPMFNLKTRLTDELGLMDRAVSSKEATFINMNYFIRAGVDYSLGGNTALKAGLGYGQGILDATSFSSDKVTTNSFTLILGVVF